MLVRQSPVIPNLYIVVPGQVFWNPSLKHWSLCYAGGCVTVRSRITGMCSRFLH